MATRRGYVSLISMLALGAAACGSSAEEIATAETDSPCEVCGPVEGDIGMGDPDAPVTIIEYASLTCPHCEHFHEDTFPELRERYVDTGQAYFIYRDYPTPPVNLAMASALLARCVPEEDYYDALSVLFRQRATLFEAARSEQGARGDYVRIANAAGLSEAEFEACMDDQDEIARISAQVSNASEQLGVHATPVFVINGVLHEGIRSVNDFTEIVDPLLEAADSGDRS